jgi:hypothetical protein
LKVDAGSADCHTTPSESGTPLLKRVRLERFIYHPEELEGTWKSRFPGDSFGASTIMTAAVVRHELYPENYPIIISVKHALMAIQANHEIGGGSGSFSADAPNKRIKQILHSQDENDKEVLTTLAPYCAAFPHELLSHPVMKAQPASMSDLLQDVTGAGYEYVAALATEIVRRGWEGPLAFAPKAKYGRYMTVDRDEIERINEVRQMIANYRNNPEQREPLAIAVFGPPGSGKSFAISELATELFQMKSSIIDRLILKFNLTQIGEIDQLHDKLHQVRTATVLGEIPIVFWDEFDTGKLMWLKYFLAPLQDSIFETSSGSYPLGKAIFIFAGGSCHNFREFNKERAGQEEAEFRDVKGPDFVSRLQGFIDIKGPNPVKPEAAKQSSSDGDSTQQRDEDSSRQVDVAHLIRRAILLSSAIKRFKPNAIDEVTNEPAISPGLVRAFLRVKEYKHGARSLEAVVKMSTLNNGYLSSDGLPPKPLLDLHVSPDFMTLIREGEEVSPVIEALAKAIHDVWYAARKAQDWRYGPQRSEEKKEHPLMLDFDELPEVDKERNRLTARVTHAKLLDVGFRIIRRQSTGDNPDGQNYISKEEYEEQLPKLMRIEHDIWLRDHLLKGYDWATVTNENLLLHRDVTFFERVPREDQVYDDVIARSIYDGLQRQGYALVRTI